MKVRKEGMEAEYETVYLYIFTTGKSRAVLHDQKGNVCCSSKGMRFSRKRKTYRFMCLRARRSFVRTVSLSLFQPQVSEFQHLTKRPGQERKRKYLPA